MEEKFKRSDRRHRSLMALKRRMKDYLCRVDYVMDNEGNKLHKKVDIYDAVLDGKVFIFLRTTGCPCNCIMCQGEKYRAHRSKNKRIFLRDIQGDLF